MNDVEDTFTSPKWDWSKVPSDAVLEMTRLGEACVADTVALGIAADQRGTTLAGIFGGGSVALCAAVGALFEINDKPMALIWAGSVAASFLFVAAITCAWSARPRPFHTCGYDPQLLIETAHNKERAYHMIEDLQDRIDHNREVLAENGRVLMTGLICAGLCIPVGAFAGWLAAQFT